MKQKPRIPSLPENPFGLHQKYYISKVNGADIDPKAEYFVLRLDDGGDEDHVKACRAAIAVYARKIKPHYPKLADDLLERYGKARTA